MYSDINLNAYTRFNRGFVFHAFDSINFQIKVNSRTFYGKAFTVVLRVGLNAVSG